MVDYAIVENMNGLNVDLKKLDIYRTVNEETKSIEVYLYDFDDYGIAIFEERSMNFEYKFIGDDKIVKTKCSTELPLDFNKYRAKLPNSVRFHILAVY